MLPLLIHQELNVQLRVALALLLRGKNADDVQIRQ